MKTYEAKVTVDIGLPTEHTQTRYFDTAMEAETWSGQIMKDKGYEEAMTNKMKTELLGAGEAKIASVVDMFACDKMSIDRIARRTKLSKATVAEIIRQYVHKRRIKENFEPLKINLSRVEHSDIKGQREIFKLASN